jgi:hypothetical protein
MDIWQQVLIKECLLYPPIERFDNARFVREIPRIEIHQDYRGIAFEEGTKEIQTRCLPFPPATHERKYERVVRLQFCNFLIEAMHERAAA